MAGSRKLTAAEITFINSFEKIGVTKPEAFIAWLQEEINKGVVRTDQARIDFGDQAFITAFQKQLIDTQKLSTQTLYCICAAFLLDGKYKAFIGDPIRSVHLFSNIYGELLRRHDLNLDMDPAEIKIPLEIEALNYGVLDYFKNDLIKDRGAPLQTLANDILQKSHTRNKKGVDERSVESVAGMIADNVASPELVAALTKNLTKKPEPIPQEYFDQLPKNVPVAEAKKKEDSQITSGLMKQYRSSSSAFFKSTKEEPTAINKSSASSPGRLEGGIEGEKKESTAKKILRKFGRE